MRYIVVIGTRPEALKLLPLVEEMRKNGMKVAVLSTNQSCDLLPPAFEAYGVKPDLELRAIKKERSLSLLVAEMTEAVGRIFARERPDAVIVQGDTASAFAAANAAFFQRIPVIHVEAGMRTGDLGFPFPEEYFRVAIDRIASLHFCPSQYQVKNLIREGVSRKRLFVTGNTVLDSLRRFVLPPSSAPKTVLFTMHRRENAGKLCDLLAMLDAAAEKHPDLTFVCPIHPARKGEIAGKSFPHLRPETPIPPRTFYALYAETKLILTDSGGIEEEAAALGIPLLVLREKTERTAEEKRRRLRLVGTDPDAIAPALEIALASPCKRKRTDLSLRPSESIAKILQNAQKILL